MVGKFKPSSTSFVLINSFVDKGFDHSEHIGVSWKGILRSILNGALGLVMDLDFA